jgi:hypothetical protein
MPRVNPKMLGEPRVEVSRIEEVERMESQHAGPELGEPGDKGFAVTVISVPDHFGRGFSTDRAEKLGELAADILKKRAFPT